MPTTAVIVQARMGSTRLPGKVLMPLAGQTVLAHVLDRCKAIAGVDAVCCATTDQAVDGPVFDEAVRCGVAAFRGSEADVLDRYLKAARWLDADIVLRVTADCPLIDPGVSAAVLRLRAEQDADYAANNMPPTWPHGLDCEAFTVDALARSAREATAPDEREHVTPWLRNHPSIRRANLAAGQDGLTAHRWTLDHPEDMRFFEAVFEQLPSGRIATLADVLSVLDRQPEIALINAHLNERRPGVAEPAPAKPE